MTFSIILKGMAMGIAEAIPGVSGGTIAFITGIYERLLAAIGGILGPKVVGTLRKEGIAPAFKAADGLQGSQGHCKPFKALTALKVTRTTSHPLAH